MRKDAQTDPSRKEKYSEPEPAGVSVSAGLKEEGSRSDEPTCLVDVLLAGVPYAGVEAAEEEAVVPGLPAVVDLVLVRLVHAIVDAVVAPLLAAGGLGDALGALAPVRGDEGGGGEEEGHQIQAHGQQRATFPCRLHHLAPAKVQPSRGAARGGMARRRCAEES